MLEFIRIACAVPAVQPGDVHKNTEDICKFIAAADEQECDLLVTPELGLTGYTCADLFFQQTLNACVKEGLNKIVDCTREHPAVTVAVGLPLVLCGQLYNCAAVIRAGVLLGVVPKTFIPNYDEFNEKRWFASAADLLINEVFASQIIDCAEDYAVPVGTGQLFSLGDGTVLGVEICEDLWAPVAPSAILAMGGAEVIVNLSASNEANDKHISRQDIVRQQSASCACVYAFCSAGSTESTQDMVFSGHSLIAQNGVVLAENGMLAASDYMLVHDADLGVVRADRRKKTSFRDAASYYGVAEQVRLNVCPVQALRGNGSLYHVEKMPFVPEAEGSRRQLCLSVFQTQASGLAKRLQNIQAKAVVGVSGGLDSTLALLVAVEAMRRLGRPISDVHAVTMPCFGTTDRTYRNALKLMKLLGVTSREVNIQNAVLTHFGDIGHDPSVHNTTYENAQARERTQVLMDYAGTVGGIVIGTGDLSELALGWCTYNGDHMSMYGVNASVPKTLLRWVVETVATIPGYTDVAEVLRDVLDTPVSPELLPPDAGGKIAQQTEDIVGPYVLHDFFLYYLLRYAFCPTKIYRLACSAFADDFDTETIKKWLQIFYRRFFSQQFKRNCQPDGVKADCLGMSPRGDWNMPSDVSARIWLEEIESL